MSDIQPGQEGPEISICDHMTSEIELAKSYAADGAFYSAAGVLLRLALVLAVYARERRLAVGEPADRVYFEHANWVGAQGLHSHQTMPDTLAQEHREHWANGYTFTKPKG